MKKSLKKILATGAAATGLLLSSPVYAKAEKFDLQNYLKPSFTEKPYSQFSSTKKEIYQDYKEPVRKFELSEEFWEEYRNKRKRGLSRFTKKELYAEIIWEIFNFIDWGQTNFYSEDYMEANPVLGEHPSKAKIDRYFTLWAIGHPIISYCLPGYANTFGRNWNPRGLFQSFSLTLSGGAVLATLIGKQLEMNSKKPEISIGFKMNF